MTITRRGALTGITMRGGLGTLARFAVDWYRPDPVIITPGDTEEHTIDDAVFEVTTPTTVDYEAQAVARPTHPDADVSQITWSTSDESIATIDASGRVTRVADGYIRIIATDQHGAYATSGLVRIYRETGAEAQTFVAWVEGSAAKAISDAIDEAIETGDVAALKPMYTSGNTRNPNCWAAELADLSCIDRNKPGAAFIGTSGGYSYAIQAGHYPDSTDTYVAMDGTVASVTVADSRRVGPTVPGYGKEIRVVRYSTALDAKFVPALLPPNNLNDYFRHLSVGVPLICTDQEKKALVADLSSLGTWATAKVPTDPRRLAFYESAITGDSGSPRFVPVDGRLMLITALTYGGAGSGPNYSQYLSEILDAIDDMGGDVEDFEIADLSGWTNYADPILALMLSYDPVAYWRFNGNYDDASGNGFTVQAWTGSPTFTDGLHGQAVSTDNANHVGRAHTSALDIGASDDFCVSFWIKYTHSGSSTQYLMSGRSNPNHVNDPGWSFYRIASGTAVLTVADGDMRLYANGGTGGWVNDTWVHVLAGIDRSAGRIRYFTNGVQRYDSVGIDGSVADLGSLANSQEMRIGAASNGAVMDEVAIFKTAPTLAMAQAIYNAGVTP